MPFRVSRRRFVSLALALPAAGVVAACGGASRDDAPVSKPPDDELGASPLPTSTPEPPFVLPSGEDQLALMAGTPYETPLYVFGSGKPGPILMVLGGVHGNEPGGWLAAEQIVKEVRPQAGGLVVVPRANKQAIALFERTTDELGDLNRLYPGNPNGLPMARMAYEIVAAARSFHATMLIDMHESWAFYRDRTDTQTGTAFLGQTMSSPGEPGVSLAKSLVDTMNSHMQAPWEEFSFREWPPRGFSLSEPPGATPDLSSTPERGTTGANAAFGGSRSSLGLPNYISGLGAILVEMGQQQPLERRVTMHVNIVKEALSRLDA